MAASRVLAVAHCGIMNDVLHWSWTDSQVTSDVPHHSREDETLFLLHICVTRTLHEIQYILFKYLGVCARRVSPPWSLPRLSHSTRWNAETIDHTFANPSCCGASEPKIVNRRRKCSRKWKKRKKPQANLKAQKQIVQTDNHYIYASIAVYLQLYKARKKNKRQWSRGQTESWITNRQNVALKKQTGEAVKR